VTTNLEQHREALAADPENVQAFEALQERHFLEGQWDALAWTYRRRLDAPSLGQDVPARVAMLFRLGQVLDERCDQVDEAVQVYWEVARLDPSFRPALRQLRQIYDGRGQWDMVLQTAEHEGQIPMDPYERGLFMAELGDVWLSHLDDPGEAQSCFQQALEADPHQQLALEGLARAYQSFGRHAEAAQCWERLIGLLRGPERAPALVALGKLYDGPLNATSKASACFRKAMTDDPLNEEAVEALVIIACAQEQWDLLGDLYERRFNLARGARHRSAIAVEAGHMELDRRGNREAARSWFERAIELADDEPSVHHAMAEILRAEGDTTRLRSCLDRLIDLSSRRAPVDILLEAAELHAEAGSEARALDYLARARKLRPDDPLVLEALSDSLSTANRPEELAEVLERRAALAADDPHLQAETLAELSRLQEEDLGEVASAIDTLARAFDLNPQLPNLTSRLRRLYRKAEAWDDLRQLLERARGQAPEGERAGYSSELGVLLLDHHADLEGARRAFESALELDPNEATALQGLERVAAESGDEDMVLALRERAANTTGDPERLAELVPQLIALLEARGEAERALGWTRKLLAHQPEHVELLEASARFEEQLGLKGDLIETLQRLEPHLQGPAKARNCRRMAELHDALGRPETAITCLEEAMKNDPTDATVMRELVRHYRETHQLQDMARVQRKLVDALPPRESAECLADLASLLDEQLGDVDAAIVVLWRLCGMAERPDDATDRLEALLERAGRFGELAQQLLERRHDLPDASDEAEALDLRRATLLMDQLGQLEEAANIFRSVRSRNPANTRAAEGLEQALRAGNDSAGLVQLLESKARSTDDPQLCARIEFERGVLLEEGLGDEEAALEIYISLSDAGASAGDPSIATQSSVRIERVLERRGDWAALRARLEAGLGQASPDEQLALHERLAGLCRDRLTDREGCITHLEALGALRPQRSDTWRDLAKIFDELGRNDDQLRAINAELRCAHSEERELALRARATRICTEERDGESEAKRVERFTEARIHAERVLELDATHIEASEFLVEHYTEGNRPADVVRLLEIRLGHTLAQPDAQPDLCTALRLRIATLRSEALNDAPGATEMLEQALEAAGPIPAIAQPLADLYESQGRDDHLAALSQQAIRSCAAPSERAAWQVRLAEALVRGGESRRASEAYCAALADRPGDRDIEARLCSLYRELDDPMPLAALLEGEIPRLPCEERIPLLMELADLLAHRLDRSEEALAKLREVLLLEADHDAAFEGAMELSESLGRQDEILQLLDARLESNPPSAERARLLEHRGQLLAGALDRPEEAASAYREAIALAPDRPRARRALRKVMERLQRWSAVLDCLHLEARDREGSARVEILERAVQIAREHLSGDAALPWLERLRVERPDDPAVVGTIAEVHRQAGRPEALLRALELQLELVNDPHARRALHLDRARVLERDLHAPGRAIAAYETAHELAPKDPQILSELDRLYDLMGRTRDRVEVLELRIECAAPDERIALHRETATLCAAALAEPNHAIPHLLHAVALSADDSAAAEQHLELIRELSETLRAAGATDAWVRAARAELALLDDPRHTDPTRQAALHHELAEAFIDELCLPAAALRHLRAAWDIACVALDDAQPLFSSGRIERIEQSLIELHRAGRDPLELAELLSRRLERGVGDAGDWLELARIRSEALHAPAAAAAAFREVLARKPGHLEAIRGLRHSSECLHEWTEVAHSLELELELGNRWSPREVMALQRRLGDVCWHRLQAEDRAMQAYRSALEALPGDLESLRALQQICELKALHGEALDLYECEANVLGDAAPERRGDVWLKTARVARTKTEEPERALRAYAQASRLRDLEPADQRDYAELLRDSGDVEGYAVSFAKWCDDPDSGASTWEHLSLAGALRELGQREAAVQRARRAGEADARNPEPWDVLAGLYEEQGEPLEARDALRRAAGLHEPRAAAERLMRAVALCPEQDLTSRAALLREAIEADPALSIASAELARVSEHQGDAATAAHAAGQALDLSAADGGLDSDQYREIALLGGRASRRLDRLEDAARFYAAVLEQNPEDAGALDAQTEVLFEQGEFEAARKLAEARLAMASPSPHRALQLAIVGRGFEHAEDDGQALLRYREALAEDEQLALAHEGIAGIHERAGETASMIEALERFINNDPEPGSRARTHLRAADALSEIGRADEAEQQLRASVEADPSLAEAWIQLTEMLAERDRGEEALECAGRALEHATQPALRSRAALAQGRLLDTRGDSRPAVDAYALAATNDPRCVEAALAGARLLRGMGDWFASAECLERFVAAHPDPDDISLARVHLEWGRLLAGPLEKVEAAIGCYERALELVPELTEAREPLTSLLAHVPDRWRDAVDSHRALLRDDPTRPASLRALLEVSRRRNLDRSADLGLAVLRAIGSASPEETSLAPARLPRAISTAPRLADRLHETARQVCTVAAPEIATALGWQDEAPASESRFLAELDRAEAELTAPGLMSLSTLELSSAIYCMTALATDPGGNCNDGPHLHALDEALGRWSRRKIRKSLGETSVREIQSIDYEAWRQEVRDVGAAMALDASGGDLRGALVALTQREGEHGESAPPESANLTSLIKGSPPASSLLRRIVEIWCDQIIDPG
jgi:tetratricopeptide (TPR) repeat protein